MIAGEPDGEYVEMHVERRRELPPQDSGGPTEPNWDLDAQPSQYLCDPDSCDGQDEARRIAVNADDREVDDHSGQSGRDKGNGQRNEVIEVVLDNELDS
jgi:hypothetical protein